MTVTITVTVTEEGFQRQPSCQDKQHLLMATAGMQFHNLKHLKQLFPGNIINREEIISCREGCVKEMQTILDICLVIATKKLA